MYNIISISIANWRRCFPATIIFEVFVDKTVSLALSLGEQGRLIVHAV